jgi:hypothetical protein
MESFYYPTRYIEMMMSLIPKHFHRVSFNRKIRCEPNANWIMVTAECRMPNAGRLDRP